MKFWGLTIKVNPLFLLVFFLFFLLDMMAEALVAFGLVIIHEFAHLIMAYSAGYKVGRIEIFPFGGMAEYSGLLEMEPWQEIRVALAGPVFNLFFALLLYLFLYSGLLKTNHYLLLLLQYNLLIFTGNLIPALPLDGGRVLRAFLVRSRGIKRGNELAIKISKYFAISGILVGIIVLSLGKANLWFLFFFFFIYGMINKEEKQLLYYILQYLSRREDFNRGLKIRELSGQVVDGSLPVKEAIYYLNPVKYSLFYILDLNSNIIGIISESRLLSSYFGQKDKELLMKDII